MKTLTKMLILLTLCVATSVSAAEVTKVTLSYENGSAVARIDVQGPFQFTHQTEVPKNGKPDRMILDVIGATNTLATSFTGLPACGISHIRTSQYSVAPEKVVRVVFDMSKPPVYQVASEGNFIKVTFTDKSLVAFATWTSGASPSSVPTAPVKPAEKVNPPTASTPAVSVAKNVPQVAQANQTIEKDRQSSLNPTSTQPTNKPAAPDQKSASTPLTVAAKPVSQVETPVTPTTSKPAVEQKPVVVATPSAPAVAKPVDQKPVVVATPTTTAAAKPVDQKPVVVATSATPVTAKPVEQKPVVVATPTTTAAAKPVDQKPVVVATSATPVTAKPVEQKPVVVATPTTTVAAKPVEQKPVVVATSATPMTAKPVEQKPVVVATPTNPATAKPVEQKPVVVATPTTPATVKPVDQKPVVATSPASPALSKPAAPTQVVTTPANLSTPQVTVNKPVSAPTAQTSVPPPTTAKPVEVSKPIVIVAQPNVQAKPNETAKPVVPTPATKPAPVPTVVASTSAQTAKPAEPAAKPALPPTPPVETKGLLVAPQKSDKPETESTPAVKKDEAKQPTPTTQATAVPNSANGPEQLAEVDNQSAGTPEDASRATARFRRSPVSASKMKGSLVAEFPQRLVIKYEDLGNRDPFATLVDDSRTNDRPNEQRIPNIEGLKLVGIIVSPTGDNRALFADKAGYSYMMQSGDKVQRGYVLRVESDKVYFQIFEYGWSRTVALTIENAE